MPKPVHTVSNKDSGLVLCGWRHAYIIGQYYSATGQQTFGLPENVQGFLTSKNRFLDRKEAHDLFIENGGSPEFEELYSEDLY